MKKLLLAAFIALGLAGCGDKGAFIEEVLSETDAQTSINKLETILKERKLTHFTTIDHTANAKAVNMHLKPNKVVIFGNPVVGTKLMECNPSMGMDLPLKFLFTTSYDGRTTISYTNPEYWSLKHNIKDKQCIEIINQLAGGMRDLANEIAKK